MMTGKKAAYNPYQVEMDASKLKASPEGKILISINQTLVAYIIFIWYVDALIKLLSPLSTPSLKAITNENIVFEVSEWHKQK